MLTIAETQTFQRLWPDYWTEDESGEFASYLALTPDARDVVPGTGGVRKLKWSRPGMGKRGGVRVVYFNRFASGEKASFDLQQKCERHHFSRIT